MKRYTVLAVLLAAVTLFPVALAAQNGADPLGPFADATTYAAGFAAAALLGAAKKWTGVADIRAWRVVKPIQPLVVGALALAVYPVVTKLTGVTDLPAPEVFARAPTAALAGVLVRELFTRLFKRRA